jgi:MFS superfamily sulfate permease-like transporter
MRNLGLRRLQAMPDVQSPASSGVATDLSRHRNFKHDVPAAVVVFLVALPLCLGIALASGAPLFSGIIAGIVGGLVVTWFTGSPLSVSGPAAGLTVIVMGAIASLGSWEAFLLSVVIAGVLQVAFGFLRAGIIAYYFPSTVIKGLLAAIGLILILKQIPHAVGFDLDPEGEMSFEQMDGRNTFTEIPYALGHFQAGAVIISMVGLALLVFVARHPRLSKIRWLPGPLVAVVAGLVLNEVFGLVAPDLLNRGELLVQIPNIAEQAEPGAGFIDVASKVLSFPDFSRAFEYDIYKTAFVLAIVASIETLLCIEAMDKLDPFKRSSNSNKELVAQGIGNICSGLIGGLPLTAVIVRGSANAQSGGRTANASFLHGVLLVLSVLAVPWLLNRIPLAALAAVLLHVGYKLAPISLFKQMLDRGPNQFIPFIVTVLAILFTDLLVGVIIGMAAGVFFILFANLQTPYYMHRREVHEEDHPEGRRVHIHLELSENVSFLNKASMNRALHKMPDGAVVEIDGSHALFIDRDVLEIIHAFAESAHHRGIDVTLTDIPPADAKPAELTSRKPVEETDNRGADPVDRRKRIRTVIGS